MARSVSPSSSSSRSSSPSGNGSKNMGVDYVISFRFNAADKSEAEEQFQNLIKALDAVGLRVEARDGRNGSILVFVRIKSQKRFIAEVYRSRVKDWLHGIRAAAPDAETQKSLDKEPVRDAERLRLVYELITLPEGSGGAGITPKQGKWDLVESIFPLHDRAFNKSWLKRWSLRWSVTTEELTLLRDKFGEKVGFYFAFLQCYFAFLIFPALAGVSAYFLLPPYSTLFAIANCLWSIIFVEWWRRQEVDLAVRWGVRGCSRIQNRRAAFQYEKVVEDPITGEKVKVFSVSRRLLRQSIQVPFALLASGVLASVIATVFAIEIFISEVYSGPFKGILVFLPTVLLSVFIPALSTILTNLAKRLNNYENYENADSYDYAITQKIFVLNFITSYVPLFLTAFVYVPFGSVIVPRLDIFGLTAEEVGGEKPSVFQINPARLKKQMIYFTFTAQIVNLALETIVPVVKRKIFKKAQEFQSARKGVDNTITVVDKEEEKKFLERVRDEAELEVYDVTDDLREMCTQFGYLALFSPIWPLTSMSFIINNWIELRSDAAKICVEMQRPTPLRADSIGPWLDNLSFLSWLGSITSAALIYMFGDERSHGPHGSPKLLTLWGLLTAILLSEHLYFAARLLVRTALSKIESPGMIMERRERYLVRKRYLEEAVGVDDKVDDSLHESEKELSSELGDVIERRFWIEQENPRATVLVGKEIINRNQNKKSQ